jgi:hypothetical protein
MTDAPVVPRIWGTTLGTILRSRRWRRPDNQDHGRGDEVGRLIDLADGMRAEGCYLTPAELPLRPVHQAPAHVLTEAPPPGAATACDEVSGR